MILDFRFKITPHPAQHFSQSARPALALPAPRLRRAGQREREKRGGGREGFQKSKLFWCLNFVFLFCLGVGVLIFGISVNAGAGENVRGWAWAGNSDGSGLWGWISFNSTDTGATQNYGVSVDSAGNFSGNAWSETLGWIWFGPYPGGTTFPTGGGATPSAVKVDWTASAPRPVSGWAFLCQFDATLANQNDCSLASNADGWVSFRGVSPDYGMTIDGNGVFSGYAWNNLIGWFQFDASCKFGNSNPLPGGCDWTTRTNFVPNQPPSASILTVTTSDACGQDGATNDTYFRWTYSDPEGTSQSAFQLEVDVNSFFNDPEVITGGSNCSGSPPTCSWNRSLTSPSDYNWRLKVTDSGNPPVDSSVVIGPPFSLNSLSWKNIKVDFSWAPLSPAPNTPVTFTNNSVCSYAACSSLNDDDWVWTFPPDATGVGIIDSNPGTPEKEVKGYGPKTLSFTIQDVKTVKLEVPDPTNASLPRCFKEYSSLGVTGISKWRRYLPF